MRIHARVNVSFILNPDNYPPDARHILAKHPEWVTYDYKGRPVTDYSRAEIKENLPDGYCLDPAVPELKEITRIIVKDIISRYQVDGIHLNFIRYPYSGFNSYYNRHMSDSGYNPITRKIFKSKHGIGPVKINPHKGSSFIVDIILPDVVHIIGAADVLTGIKNLSRSPWKSFAGFIKVLWNCF